MGGWSAWGFYTAVAALALGVTLLALKVWSADWAIPWSTVGDAIPVAAHFKTTFETGWYEHQALLGAPLGQKSHDLPHRRDDELPHGDDPGTAVRELGDRDERLLRHRFSARAAVSAAWFIRVAGGSRLLALPTAVLYAILPFHFVQGEQHMFVSACSSSRSGWCSRFVLRAGRRSGAGGGAPLTPSAGGLGADCRRSSSPSSSVRPTPTSPSSCSSCSRPVGSLPRCVIAGGSAQKVTCSPSRSSSRSWASTPRRRHLRLAAGLQPRRVRAAPAEDSEYFAFKLAQLLLPWSGHRIRRSQSCARLYDEAYPLVSEQPASDSSRRSASSS